MFSFRSVLLGASLLAVSAFASPASAASVSYEGNNGNCARSVEVVQWAPQKGPIARFVADKFLASISTGLWIGLGRSGKSFWSAEGGDASDACPECRELRLVETRADGTRKRYHLWSSEIEARVGVDPAAQKAHILAELWKLAAGTWPSDKLTQDYSLTLGRPDAPNANPSQVFAVAVQAKKSLNLRYDFSSSPSACWCIYDWTVR